ncbi:MAG TPA: phosphotransferase [Burkholderiaceae bacterium]|nr:phosphotransferase [Burkholderiaceae bacterium]
MFEQFVGTSPVQERHRFDVVALAAYLRDHVHDEGVDFSEPLVVEQFKGGQSNPTFLLRTPARHYVLRRKPPGVLLPSAHAIEREYRVMDALHASAVPVPRMLCLCEDASVIGSAFYVMEHVQGRILWDPALPGFQPDARARLFDDMNRVIAALHRVDVAAAGLADYGKPGNYFARQIGRWSAQYRASETERIEAMDRLIDWLPQHVPAGDATALVHGDYRLDNLVFHATEPRVVAVLDWELSTLGHPMADFAYHALAWSSPAGVMRGLAGLDLAALGIPSAEAYVERYCERVGMAPPSAAEWSFYLAYNLFRGAAISQGILKRALDGSASSAHAYETGSRARAVAEAGWRQIADLG